MRLGLPLLNVIKIMPYRFRGKNRIVKKPTMHDLLKMKQDFEREERNMLILRHPYLTVEQSNGHMKAVVNRYKEFMDKKFEENRTKFQKEITYAERLAHMRVSEAWD